jgi:hypothetical protein
MPKERIIEVEQIRAKYRFAVVFLLSIIALILAVLPVGAMYASQLDLLADTGIDGVTNRDLVDALYPVGTIYFTTNSANPGNSGGVFEDTNTTWVRWGAGRVPMGVGVGGADGVGNKGATSWTYYNNSGTLQTVDIDTVEATGGEYNWALAVNQMPNHNHNVRLKVAGAANGSSSGNQPWNQGNWTGWGTSVDGELEIQASGGGQAHPLMQPYITCYMWKRTV